MKKIIFGYSFYINSLKKILFFISFLLILLTIFNKTIRENTYLNKTYNFSNNDSEQVIIEPKFLGINNEKKPFLIRATKAEKSSTEEDLYQLYSPYSEMKNKKGALFYLNSVKGKFYQKKQEIFLYENVELRNDDGLSFKTNSAFINLETNDIFGNQKIFGNDKKKEIFSEGFKIKNQGDLIIFNGPTNLIIKNENVK